MMVSFDMNIGELFGEYMYEKSTHCNFIIQEEETYEDSRDERQRMSAYCGTA